MFMLLILLSGAYIAGTTMLMLGLVRAAHDSDES